MLPFVAGEGEVSAARKAAVIFLYGMFPEGDGVNGFQQLRGNEAVVCQER